MRAYVGQKQLPAFFKFQVAGQRQNMKSALALQRERYSQWNKKIVLQMSLGEVKKELKKLDKDQIINIISDLYNKNKSVKEYLEFFLNPNEATILKEYKTKVFESFYPRRGFGYKLSEGKKAITDFKKLGTSQESVSDLMLFYVESGIKFTNDYGDINESFYNSLATTYHQALKLMRVEGVLEKFEDRAGQIIKDTENIGWGFHDYLSQVFCDYYPDEYDDE